MNKQLVLAGCGHAHLLLLRQTPYFLSQKIRPLLIDPDAFWHAGLSVGVLGGVYGHEENRIDPAPLAKKYGFEFIKDRITGIDLAAGDISLSSGKTMHFDALSFNIGSVVATESFDGPLQHTWTVKPSRNLSFLRHHLEALFQKKRNLKICVLGGGPSGCEVAGNLSALAARYQSSVRINLICSSIRLLPNASQEASRMVEKLLKQRGVKIFLGQKVQRIDEYFCRTADGKIYEFDKIVLATGLKAPPLFRIMGLQTSADGSLKVRKTLQSASDPRVFGAGDCIEFDNMALPKIRAHGIRQAPILKKNLAAFLRGKKLKNYVPQEKHLSILNLGFKRGLALKDGKVRLGRISFYLKNWNEKRFVESNH